MKKILSLILGAMLLVVILVACGGNDDTIQTCMIANESYSEKNDLEAATQPESLTTDSPTYASVHIVESPKGMEYTIKWYLDDAEIKTETKATENDRQDIIVYELEAENVVTGNLKVEVCYKDTVLITKEIPIK
jgi:hypothetical protein